MNLSSTKQILRGDAASVWCGRLKDSTMDILLKDMGISVLRVRIDQNKKWSDELSNAEKVRARGAIDFCIASN